VYPLSHAQSVPSARQTAFVAHGVCLSHAVHTTPSESAAYPSMHVQSVNASLPDAELVPSGHVEHCSDPIESLYVPTSQGVQKSSVEMALYLPMGHVSTAASDDTILIIMITILMRGVNLFISYG
jgi:hypothetical protein